MELSELHILFGFLLLAEELKDIFKMLGFFSEKGGKQNFVILGVCYTESLTALPVEQDGSL